MEIYARPSQAKELTLSGAPSGLSDVGVRVIDTPSNAVVVTRVAAAEVLPGSGLYAAVIATPSSSGTYTILWDTGSVTPDTTATDTLVINAAGTLEPVSSPNLLTLQEAKNGGVKGTDDQINQAVAYASSAIRAYTDRDFGIAPTLETRRYEYDGSGILDIDDATAVTALAMVYDWGSYTVPTSEWRAQPYGESIYSYVLIPGRWGVGSPEMGFVANADVLASEGRLGLLAILADVTATYGWPDVPGDVRQAAVWTAAGIRENPGNFIASQAIEGYSRGYTPSPSQAIPERAKDLLASYIRLKV